MIQQMFSILTVDSCELICQVEKLFFEDVKRKILLILVVSSLMIEFNHQPGTHWAFCDALLPLTHSDTFLQGGAFLQQQIPSAVWVPRSYTSSER